ncbi:MAG: SDR family NAD(P)-dependent oxidoreductase [Bacteroidales bacterium]|nr:SDR family NAD(P)-dependent oxidoreductase [Bacteroidales bacterium]MDD4209186.1 SDR family NAD(P)-dependent oxidoreductase [Bacteroidales bacterium]
MKAKDKIIIVTGGGNGIGRELVLHLLSKHARVIAIDIQESALIETKKLAGNKADKLFTHVLNITDKEAVFTFVETIIATHKGIDGIINNAGIIQPFIRVNNLDFNAIERVMDVNFYGSLYLIKALLPHLLTRPEAHIVNISSMGGFISIPGQSMYAASKAAIKLLTEGLYAELMNTKVKVSIVFPGAIQTNISVNSGLQTKVEAEKQAEKSSMKTLAADKAAEIIINGMEKDKFRILVGKDAKMLDFIYRLSPKYATEMVAKKMKSLLQE